MLRVLMKAPTVIPTKLKLTCNEYGYFVDKETQQRTFGVLGERKLQEFIHSFVDQCDYTVIMRSLMPSVADFDDFGDLFEIAEDIHDVNDILAYGSVLREQFNNLPLEVKIHYGNNYELFARDVIGGSFADFITKKYGPQQSSQGSSGDNSAGDSVVQVVPGGAPEAGQGDGGARELVGQLQRELAELRAKVEGQGGQS